MLGPRGKGRSLQGLLESTKKNGGSHAFFEKISLESWQKFRHQHFPEKEGKDFSLRSSFIKTLKLHG